jgi:hypothetical protein
VEAPSVDQSDAAPQDVGPDSETIAEPISGG